MKGSTAVPDTPKAPQIPNVPISQAVRKGGFHAQMTQTMKDVGG